MGKRPTAEGRGRRTFTDEFRRSAVELMRQRRREGASLAQIGRELAVRPALLWEWARKLDGRGTGQVEAPGVAPASETLDEEVRRLRREVARLREERDFAKKAAAFFARESP